MRLRRGAYIPIVCAFVCLCVAVSAWATEYHGQVFYGGVPVPGATVTVTQGNKHFSTVTDRQGLYEFADIPDGQGKIEIAMSGFVTLDDAVTIGPDVPQRKWELNLLGLKQILSEAQVSAQLKARPENATRAGEENQKPAEDAAVPPAAPPDQAEQSADGMLISGSQNNAATSQYALSPACGNRRPGQRGQYNGDLGLIFGNSALNARPYSLSGQQTPKDFYNRITGIVTLGGPLRIPHLMPIGPNFFVSYQWTRSALAADQTGLVPNAAERSGDLSGLTNAQGQPVTVYDPATGLPFTGNIPVSAQAAALLNLYPLPNVAGNTRYNYQAGVLNNTHIDALQSRLTKVIGRRDQLYGGFGFMSTRENSKSLFGFVDATNSFGIDTNMNWSHRFLHQTHVLMTYHLTRLRTAVQPMFEGQQNISGLAGIGGNNQDPQNWGPPNLMFSSGISGLGDANSAFNRNRTDALNVNVSTNYRRHYFVFGGDFRRQEYNVNSQQNPRGMFTFTGAATQQGGSSAGGASTTTGSDLADFLLGIPDASAISFGNPDKYFRQSVYDLYFTDDWRLMPQLTIDAGVRWDYGAPMTELFGRLANIDVSQGFASVAPVLATSPKGPVSGLQYPTSLVRPDRKGFAPRIGISWRPIPASTLVVRAGYGIYYDTSVYLSATEAMATQAPFATSVSQANGSACSLTLANGFMPCASAATDTFGIDPNLRVGYAQVWDVSVQRDLPWALVGSVTYLGTKGTHGMQEFLPNTYPIGGVNPCPACNAGFVYRTSGGNSTRNAAQVQLRRRLRSGLTATLDYTWAKAMDNDAQVGAAGHQTATNAVSPFGTSVANTAGGGPAIAQDWRDLTAERSLSNFDQRQLLKFQIQYTTGMGMGRELMSGWHGRLLKEWTVGSQFSFGTGLPETPIYLATVPGTSFTNTIRPDVTGAPVYGGSTGLHLNDAAFAAPSAGAWGTARRNSITGPDTFSLDSSMSRTFRLRNPLNLDVRIDATNVLNRGVFTGWNSVVNSTTFGLPAQANPMRSVQVTARMRF
jgi:Carboxypeptidase regulatory-like domain